MDQFGLINSVVETLNRLSIRHFVTGSIASSYYGEYRSSHDVDIVVDLKLSDVRPFCGSFPLPDFYLEPESVREAIAARSQFNIIYVPEAMKVDVFVQDRSQFDATRFARSRQQTLADGSRLWLASPEDVILKKLLYFQEGGSEKHLRDIAGILRVSGALVDHDYIRSWAATLGVLAEWELVAARGESAP